MVINFAPRAFMRPLRSISPRRLVLQKKKKKCNEHRNLTLLSRIKETARYPRWWSRGKKYTEYEIFCWKSLPENKRYSRLRATDERPTNDVRVILTRDLNPPSISGRSESVFNCTHHAITIRLSRLATTIAELAKHYLRVSEERFTRGWS